jgi:hypothetical protein
MPLMGNAAAHGGMARDHRREMSAGRPASDEKAVAVEPEFAGAPGQHGHRLTNFLHDVGEAHVGRQRVADGGDVDCMGTRSVGHNGEHVLVVSLPVAAVDEHEQRRPGRSGGDVVEAGARPAAIGNIEPRACAREHGGAAPAPARDPLLAVGHGIGVVVGGIKRGAVHAAVDRGSRPLGASRHVRLPFGGCGGWDMKSAGCRALRTRCRRRRLRSGRDRPADATHERSFVPRSRCRPAACAAS